MTVLKPAEYFAIPMTKVTDGNCWHLPWYSAVTVD